MSCLYEHLETIAQQCRLCVDAWIHQIHEIRTHCLRIAQQHLKEKNIPYRLIQGIASWRVNATDQGVVETDEAHQWIDIDGMISDPCVPFFIERHAQHTKQSADWLPSFVFLHPFDCRDSYHYETGSVAYQAHDVKCSAPQSSRSIAPPSLLIKGLKPLAVAPASLQQSWGGGLTL